MPLPGVGRAHKPCAAALFCKHSEHRRCKMCDFDQKYEFINSLSLFLLAEGGPPYRETCST